MQLEQYVHVLLFACPKCASPIASTCLKEEKNLEAADTAPHTLVCHCGWRGESLGASASKHWVERWGKRKISRIQT
jgi:hypothetical protein